MDKHHHQNPQKPATLTPAIRLYKATISHHTSPHKTIKTRNIPAQTRHHFALITVNRQHHKTPTAFSLDQPRNHHAKNPYSLLYNSPPLNRATFYRQLNHLLTHQDPTITSHPPSCPNIAGIAACNTKPESSALFIVLPLWEKLKTIYRPIYVVSYLHAYCHPNKFLDWLNMIE